MKKTALTLILCSIALAIYSGSEFNLKEDLKARESTIRSNEQNLRNASYNLATDPGIIMSDSKRLKANAKAKKTRIDDELDAIRAESHKLSSQANLHNDNSTYSGIGAGIMLLIGIILMIIAKKKGLSKSSQET